MCVFSCFLLQFFTWTSTAKYSLLFCQTRHIKPSSALYILIQKINEIKEMRKRKEKYWKMTRIFCGTWRRKHTEMNWMTAMMVKCLLLWQSVALPFLIINSSMVNFVRILRKKKLYFVDLKTVKKSYFWVRSKMTSNF